MSTGEPNSAARADVKERLKQYLHDVDRAGASGCVPEYRSRRYPYRTTQWVAPYSGDGPPETPEFQKVRCRDLSTSGLSFFWPELPEFRRVVVKLGDGVTAIHVTARIVRAEPVDDTSRPAYLVGCQFTGRVLPPDQPST